MHYKVWNIIFLQMPGAGWITVKKTSRAPSVAMESLKLPVDLIKTISGTMALHKSLKTEFEPHSVSGHDDWYSPVPELLARIDSIEDYDGGEPPPPPPEPEAPRHYEDLYYYCSGCNGQFDEYEKDDLITVGEDYTDYGEVHLYGSLEHGHLCRRCALGGGLTNIIYPIFYENRMSLSPYWEQSDESFLSKCSCNDPIYESIRYVWIKAQVLTRLSYARFIEGNPTGSISDAKDFIVNLLDVVEKE